MAAIIPAKAPVVGLHGIEAAIAPCPAWIAMEAEAVYAGPAMDSRIKSWQIVAWMALDAMNYGVVQHGLQDLARARPQLEKYTVRFFPALAAEPIPHERPR